MNLFPTGYSDVSKLMFGSLQIRQINLEETKHMFVKRLGRFTVYTVEWNSEKNIFKMHIKHLNLLFFILTSDADPDRTGRIAMRSQTYGTAPGS
jgi:hypothetical protein